MPAEDLGGGDDEMISLSVGTDQMPERKSAAVNKAGKKSKPFNDGTVGLGDQNDAEDLGGGDANNANNAA